MELYNLIATKHNTSGTYTLLDLPENFKGVKITQNFSFNIPIGYTPKFSVETMRIILEDKSTIDAIFDTYGLQSNVTINIQKLNATGIGYTDFLTFAIDFESYEKFDVYSEFALKSISSYDLYINKKNTEKSYILSGYYDFTTNVNLPNTLKCTNYVSLKSKKSVEDYSFEWENNNDSKIYDEDSSLFNGSFPSISTMTIYSFGMGTPIGYNYIHISSKANLYFVGVNATITIKIMKYNSSGSGEMIFYTLFSGAVISSGTNVSINLTNTSLLYEAAQGDYLMIIVGNASGATITGDFFIDIKKQTFYPVLNSENNTIKYLRTKTYILDDIFNGQVTTTDAAYLEKGLTSANHLAKNSDVVTLKPQEFVSDLCKLLGLVINAKINGTTQIEKISDYFNTILDVDNAIELTDYHDVSIKQNTDLAINSISVGQETKDYTLYAYFLNWFKVLTFNQTGRYGTENFDISLSKFRTDFSGMLDYYVMRSSLKDKDYKDNFIFDPAFTEITASNESGKIYDAFTPRNMLTNWKRFLSFCFFNFGLNTLTLSSNGGTPDNLTISGVSQMDDFVFSDITETPRLLPIEYNLTCAIELIDFSNHILKINDNSTDVYLFVIKSETTDQINEQKITGLKIQLT